MVCKSLILSHSKMMEVGGGGGGALFVAGCNSEMACMLEKCTSHTASYTSYTTRAKYAPISLLQL